MKINEVIKLLAYVLIGIWAILVSVILIDYMDTKTVIIECISILQESVSTLSEAVKLLL